MPDYSNGKIYKIVCNITGDIYIGSTCEPILARRLAGHVSTYKSYLNGKGNNITSFKIIANGNYDIVLIELFPCDTKDQLHARESHYTQTIQCVNRIKNQGLCNALGGKNSYDKFYRDDHKEQIKQYTFDNKERKKQYDVTNQEHIRTQQKTVLICQCGSLYTRCNKSHHEQTNKHQEYLKNQIYYDIRRGLDIIKKLDNYFKV
jgi:hypothetical protein